MKLSKATDNAIENVKSLADLVREAREAVYEAVIVGRPEGAVTIDEYAEGPPRIGRTTARDQLNKAVSAGRMEKIYSIVADGEGRPRKVQFYRKVKRNDRQP